MPTQAPPIDLQSVPCRKCLAPAGMPCTGANGSDRKHVHAARHGEAVRAGRVTAIANGLEAEHEAPTDRLAAVAPPQSIALLLAEAERLMVEAAPLAPSGQGRALLIDAIDTLSRARLVLGVRS